MGKGYSNDAYEDIVYKHPDWKQTATDYEAKFAANLSNDPIVKESAHGVLTKLSKMLNSYYDVQDFKKAHPEEYKRGDFSALYSLAQRNLGGPEVKVGNTLEDALLTQRENRGSAGQIGNKVLELSEEDKQDAEKVAAAHGENQAMLDDVINGEGNLREQMTLLYNGFFQNGGRSKEEIANSRSFKNMMSNITQDDADMMRKAGLQSEDDETRNLRPDFDIINEQSAHKKGGDIMDTVSVAYGVASAHDKKKGRGNAVSRFFKGIARIFKSTRSGRKFVNKKGFGEDYYNRLGIQLSQRERSYGTNGGTEELQWQEGGRLFEMSKPVTAEGMLQVAGASGTALRMLSAYRMMGANKKDLLYFRLALIGWMCSSRDHSLYEIMKGSHNAGVKGYEDLSDAVAMYQSVDPLSPEEIRENYAPNREYPHETIYKKILQEAGEARKGVADEKNKKVAEKYPGYDYESKIEEVRQRKGRVGVLANESKLLLNEVDELNKSIEEIENQISAELEKVFAAEGDIQLIQYEIEQLKITQREKEALREKIIEKCNEKRQAISEEKDLAKALQDELTGKGFNVKTFSDYNLFDSKLAEVKDGNATMNTKDLNAQDIALNVYTTQAFKVMNESQKYGETIAKYRMKNVTSQKNAYKGSNAEELANDNVVDKVLVALRLSNRIAQDALSERSAVSKEEYDRRKAQRIAEGEDVVEDEHSSSRYSAVVTTMRGGKTPGAMYGGVGSIYKTTNLTSTSKNILVADGFYAEASEGKNNKNVSIMEFHLTGKSGVDVSSLSEYEYEEEVLLPPNTTFKIVEPLTEKVFDGTKLRPLSDFDEDEIMKMREDAKSGSSSLRNHVVLEEVEGPKSKFRNQKYLHQRVSRNKKKEELQKRIEAFKVLKDQRRAAQAQAQ